MKSLNIRGIEESLYLTLSEQAEELELSVPELVRKVLANYAAAPELVAIDAKYRIFLDDVQQALALDLAELKNQSEELALMLRTTQDMMQELMEERHGK